MYSLSPDRNELDGYPVHLVQRFQVIDGGKQTEPAPTLAKWIRRDGKLICQWNVKQQYPLPEGDRPFGPRANLSPSGDKVSTSLEWPAPM